MRRGGIPSVGIRRDRAVECGAGHGPRHSRGTVTAPTTNKERS
ncbi:hypothetical protein GZL_00738 [Streptomyces sp. 769]|nr:hypothetical protein GZL_00738 [Streptomyces sp. 769]